MTATYVEEQDGLIRAEITVDGPFDAEVAKQDAKARCRADGYVVRGLRSVKEGPLRHWIVTLGVRRREG